LTSRGANGVPTKASSAAEGRRMRILKAAYEAVPFAERLGTVKLLS